MEVKKLTSKREDKVKGIDFISIERERQVKEEGWTKEHDAEHVSGELLLLAACYVLKNYTFADYEKEIESELFMYWGSDEWIKYKDPVRDLTKAGALIAAEIDRINNLDPSDRH